MSDTTRTPPDPKRPLTEAELICEELSDWRMLIDRLRASSTPATSSPRSGSSTPSPWSPSRWTTTRTSIWPTGGWTFGCSVMTSVGSPRCDVALARAISDLARAAGVASCPERTSVLELGLDSADEAEIGRSGRPCSCTTPVQALGGNPASRRHRAAGDDLVPAHRTPTRSLGSVGASTCASRPRRSSAASPPRSRPAVSWSTTRRLPRSGGSPTPRATGPASRPGRVARSPGA